MHIYQVQKWFKTVQALMFDWWSSIWVTWQLIIPAKTRWFLVSFFWNSNAWEYETKDSLSGVLILPDKDGHLYTVNREDPTTPFKSLGLQIDLANTSSKAFDNVTDECKKKSTQINNAKCDKTSCLNAFNTLCHSIFRTTMEQSNPSSNLSNMQCSWNG